MQDKFGKIIDRREMLKVKCKSLAEEARIIRREENRATGQLHNELHEHRVRELRWHARDAHVAYGLVKGRAYEQIECKTLPQSSPNWENVERMCKKYGPKDFVLVRPKMAA